MQKRLRRLWGKALCGLRLHRWKDWEHGDAFQSRECSRRGCDAIELKGRQW